MTQGLGNTLLQYLQSKMDNCTKNVGERAPTLVWWWSSPSTLSWWSPLPMNIKTTSRSTAMVSPKISLFFFFSEFRQILTMNLFLCEIAAVPWLQLAFETFLHWGLILLFIDVNWNFFSSNHFRREVSYCNRKEIHVHRRAKLLTYLDITWNLRYLVIKIKKSVDNFVITKCGLTSICHFHEILFWNLKQLCKNSVKSF